MQVWNTEKLFIDTAIGMHTTWQVVNIQIRSINYNLIVWNRESVCVCVCMHVCLCFPALNSNNKSCEGISFSHFAVSWLFHAVLLTEVLPSVVEKNQPQNWRKGGGFETHCETDWLTRDVAWLCWGNVQVESRHVWTDVYEPICAHIGDH